MQFLNHQKLWWLSMLYLNHIWFNHHQ